MHAWAHESRQRLSVEAGAAAAEEEAKANAEATRRAL